MRRICLALVLAMTLAAAAESRTRAVRHPSPASNIDRIFFAEFRPAQVRPGSERPFALYEVTGAGPFAFRPATGIDVQWTVEPRGFGATIDTNGLLRVEDSAGAGVGYRVYANLQHGERIISMPVTVFRPGANPFLDAGVWRQTAEIPCDGSPDRAVTNGIQELRFEVDHTFSVTWVPFEIRTDYGGPYVFDASRKTMEFLVTNGNDVPEDVDREGSYELVPLGPPVPTSWGTQLQPMQLRFINLYFGTSRSAAENTEAMRPCGMVFVGQVELP